MIKLTVVDGPDAGCIFVPAADRIVIGRGQTCDVVLHDSIVSRRHCVIQCEGGNFVLFDQHTPNGTFLNESRARITTHTLRDGDELILGSSRLRVELPVVLEGKPAAITPELGGDNIPSSQNFTPVKNYPSWFQDPLESLPGNWQSGMTVINTIPKISPVPERRSPAAERLQYGWEGSVGRVSPRLNTIQLTVVNGPDAGLVFTSTADSIVIGRERSCDVVLHDSGVSRRHCIVHDKKGIFEVIDLHTPNGTFLNNSQTRISAHVLKDGDELTVGKSRLRITLPVSDKKRVMTVELEEGDLAARQIPAHSYDSPSWVMGPGESLPENWQSGMTMMGAVPKMPPVSQNPAPTAELPTYKRKGILARLTARWRRLVWALKAPLP